MDVDAPQNLPWWILGAAFGILTIISGLFSGAEVAVFSLGRSGRLRKRGNAARYTRVRRLLKHSERTLTTVKVATLILNIAAAMMATRLVLAWWPSGRLGAVWAGLGLAALVLSTFGAALPRAVATRWPERFALHAASVIEVAGVLLSPVRRPLHWLASHLAPSPLSSRQISRSIQGEEEFKALLSTSEVSGLLHEDEREMIDSVFEFADTTADEIMTPRTDIEGYPIDLPQEDLVEALQQTPFSRVVAYENTMDQIVGILHAKEVLLDPATPWTQFLRKPLFVPSAMELDDLLTQFKRGHSRLAIVLDEYGGVAGLVTMHDLIEEIVGEMPEEEEQQIRDIDPIEPGIWLVAGRVELAECNDAIGTEFPEDTARTVAGLVFTRLGEVPKVGDELELHGTRLRVVELEENRIERLEIQPNRNRVRTRSLESAEVEAARDAERIPDRDLGEAEAMR